MGEYLSVTTGEIGLISVTGDDVATVAELQKVVWSVCVLGGESNSSLALTIKGEKLFRHDWRGRNGGTVLFRLLSTVWGISIFGVLSILTIRT